MQKNRLIFFLIKIKKKLKQRTYYWVDWLKNTFDFAFSRHRVFTVPKNPWCRQRYNLYVRLLMYTRLFPSKSTSARGDQIDTLKHRHPSFSASSFLNQMTFSTVCWHSYPTPRVIDHSFTWAPFLFVLGIPTLIDSC